jgi:hypothetical protein
MKAKVYMRVAVNEQRRKHQVAVGLKANYAPLTDSRGNALPTVAFALVLDVPDELFARAEQAIAEIKIPEDQVAIAAEVKELA